MNDSFFTGINPLEETTQTSAPVSEIRSSGISRATLKFCRDCGAAWQAQWTQRQACLPRQTPASVQLPAMPEAPGVGSALILYFLLLGICLIAMLIARTSANPINTSTSAAVIMSLLVLGWAAHQWDQNLAGLLTIPSPHWFVLAIGLSFMTFAIGAGFIHAVQTWFNVPVAKGSMKTAYGSWGLAVLAVAVQPAVIEELAFRGIILGSLQRTLKVSEAILVSAMMFMVLHLSPERFPHTLALGLAAGYIRTRSKSILPCMVMHFSHNFLCIAQEWA